VVHGQCLFEHRTHYNIVSREKLFDSFQRMRNEDDEEITDLIEELKRVRIQEAHILVRLEIAHNRNRNTRREGTNSDAEESDTEPPPFSIGDHVYVTNQVRRPRNWDNRIVWDSQAARRGIVTSIEPGRVYYTNEAGTSTWRAPGNLRRL
jgi:hypothetical protein